MKLQNARLLEFVLLSMEVGQNGQNGQGVVNLVARGKLSVAERAQIHFQKMVGKNAMEILFKNALAILRNVKILMLLKSEKIKQKIYSNGIHKL